MCILTLRGGLGSVRVPLVVGWGALLGARGLEACSPNSLQCRCPLTQLPPSDSPQSWPNLVLLAPDRTSVGSLARLFLGFDLYLSRLLRPHSLAACSPVPYQLSRAHSLFCPPLILPFLFSFPAVVLHFPTTSNTRKFALHPQHSDFLICKSNGHFWAYYRVLKIR